MGIVNPNNITPTTKEQREIYRTSSIKKLNYDQWFWHHPSAYRYFRYGIPIVFFIMFSGAAVFTRILDWYMISTFFFGAISLLVLLVIFRTHKELKYLPKGATMYDMIVDHETDYLEDKKEEGCNETCKI